MEQLLHYCWKHRMFPLGTLHTTDGRTVEVIDPGLHNRNAGPDFFNAKIKVDGELWVGNVEIHCKSSDWFVHGHQHDEHYNNVVLHVASVVDTEVHTANGLTPPQMQLDVPEAVRCNYEELLKADNYPPCYKIVPSLPRITVHAWMGALETERLERKTEDIGRRAQQSQGSWETAYFVTMARNYGFGINNDAMEQWAMSIPLGAVGHHRDDLFQVEAFFLGQAGLLDPLSVPERHREAALADDYYLRLSSEYKYLAHKFGLKPIDHHLWRFLRLRPQNFPHIRISQLARLYHLGKTGLSQLIECEDLKAFQRLLATQTTDYWHTHYAFGCESAYSEKRLSASSLTLLLINTVVPMLFAYGRHKRDERLCQRAFDLLDQLHAEDNHIVRMWKDCGLPVDNAGDSQALIQLKNDYCDRRDCLRCRFGYEYLKGNQQGAHPANMK